MPSAAIYRSVFAWDSGWHYYWLRLLDPERARAELRSLFACAESDGRLPHETPLPGESSYGLGRRVQLALLRRSFTHSGASWFIDPPVSLLAAADSGDPGLMGAARRALSWIEANRLDLSAPRPFDALPAVLHCLETGTDFSPSFDAVWGRPPFLQAASLASLRRLERLGWSLAARNFAARNFAKPPLLYDPCFISFYLGAKRALEPGDSAESLIEDYWKAAFDAEAGLFRQFVSRGGRPAEPRGAPSFSALLPLLLYAGGEHREEARRAIARNALPGGAFWRLDLPSFNPEALAPSRSLWRGACSWANMNYCHYSMLRLFGFEGEAALLCDRLTRRLKEGPAWEYLEPRPLDASGGRGGGGAEPFSWNGLLLAMAEGKPLRL